MLTLTDTPKPSQAPRQNNATHHAQPGGIVSRQKGYTMENPTDKTAKLIRKLELITGDKLYTYESPTGGFSLMSTTRSHINGLYYITQAPTLDALQSKIKKITRAMAPRKESK